MPCNPGMVTYWERHGAKGRVVTPNGDVVSCDFDGPESRSTGLGYIPHFSTCQQALNFKKR